MEHRNEKDTMGVVSVPDGAYYGPQTQRAVNNFPISDLRMPLGLVHALASIKGCAARVNNELGHIDDQRCAAIVEAAREINEGALDDQFVVDVFQTGSGTSTNMNVNEVIASRANEMLTGRRGGKHPVHPNDHVNLGQSSNDIIPSAIHIAAVDSITSRLLPSLERLHAALADKAEKFAGIRKIGRTHLQDAVPMTLGQEFSGYARQIELGIQRTDAAVNTLSALALGGTAVGTGLNAHPEFAQRVISLLSSERGLSFREAENHFQAQATQDAVVDVSGVLKTMAVSLVKIANDVRWLASGPRCGIGEINVPMLQPGSSIMPGKVNPVIPEAVIQVAAQVVGNDTTITMGGQGGNFELNVMMPVMAYNLLQSIQILSTASAVFAEKCIEGVTANPDVCAGYIERSLALVTGLVPHIGYDRAAALAKKAYDSGKSIREVALEENVLPEEQLHLILTSDI
jgi:fumarate hydratase class II